MELLFDISYFVCVCVCVAEQLSFIGSIGLVWKGQLHDKYWSNEDLICIYIFIYFYFILFYCSYYTKWTTYVILAFLDLMYTVTDSEQKTERFL